MVGGSVVKLNKVEGYANRCNDVLYSAPVFASSDAPRLANTVVYFGGDMQDLEENMKVTSDHAKYMAYSLESMTELLHARFPQDHVVIVRPSRMEAGTFSCYDNFVESDRTGVPTHALEPDAVSHLYLLLKGISDKINTQKLDPGGGETESEDEDEEEEEVRLERGRLRLVAFSKGCVVLNQMLYAMHYAASRALASTQGAGALLFNITDMYWLDGGHAGHSNTWVNALPVLQSLAKLKIGVHIHVTPYQVDDAHRPWIKNEEKRFREVLQEFGTSVNRSLHFEAEAPSVLKHFQVLQVFGKGTPPHSTPSLSPTSSVYTK